MFNVRSECGVCRFFRRETGREGEPVGRCVRFPPTIDPAAPEETLWPMVRVSGWCGEFEIDAAFG